MTTQYIRLTEAEFDMCYPVLCNRLNPTAAGTAGDFLGCLFGTSGKEFEFVCRQDPRAVWTLIDGEEGKRYLVSGRHAVNPSGYVISTVLVPRHVCIQVHLPSKASREG